MINSLRTLNGSTSRQMLRTAKYAELGRIAIVTKGSAVCLINLVPYSLREGDVWIIPQHSYMSLDSMSDDFDGRAVSFQRLPVSFERSIVMHLAPEDFGRMMQYFDLLWLTVHSPHVTQTITHLQAAMAYDLEQIHGAFLCNEKPKSHGENILQRFLDLLGAKDPLPRNVKAYADRLCISPNHLSFVVRQQSGRSVMDWINANCILRAQVLLQYSDTNIGDVAFRLGFDSHTFFSRFFRKETGVSPKEYRSSVRL